MTFLSPVQGTPGWFDDPTTPGVTRYWDGQRWTEQISDRGTQAVDPM